MVMEVKAGEFISVSVVHSDEKFFERKFSVCDLDSGRTYFFPDSRRFS